jgi:hypothetical protein
MVELGSEIANCNGFNWLILAHVAHFCEHCI